MVSLVDNNNIVITQSMWEGYIEPAVGDTLSVFFNKYGAACCHVYGVIGGKDDFFEYLLNCNGQAKRARCVVRVDSSSVECDLKEVLRIPAVMKAFLQSPYVYECAAFGEFIKLYYLNKVVMPEEYKKYAEPAYWINCADNNCHDDCSGYYNF